jgi:L-ascorbate metabolism protein UlaG (beta-lactamase superfamily)
MEIAITHSSTACVLLEIGSIRILTDPVLDQGSKRYRLGPGAWATRWIGPAVPPETLLPLDAVLLSHAHHCDNLDEAGKALLPEAGRIITGSHDDGDLGANRVALKTWEETTLLGSDGLSIRITATPARHGPWWLPGVRKVNGFVLQWEGQRHGGLYISGDTVFFRGIHHIVEKFSIGTALLHLGSVHFWPPWPPWIRFTFSGREAARCAQLMKAKTIVPIHYERSVWSHFREPWESYKHEFDKRKLLNCVKRLDHGIRTLVDV